VSKTEMADKHCGVESLKNSILDISESLKLFKSMEIGQPFLFLTQNPVVPSFNVQAHV
jgi:hypothetical protein